MLDINNLMNMLNNGANNNILNMFGNNNANIMNILPLLLNSGHNNNFDLSTLFNTMQSSNENQSQPPQNILSFLNIMQQLNNNQSNSNKQNTNDINQDIYNAMKD